MTLYNKKSNDFCTGHWIYFRNFFFMLTVAHFGAVECPHVVCPMMDVQISFGCPNTTGVINATKHVPLRTGDETCTLGYIADKELRLSRYWTGTLAGNLGRVVSKDGVPFLAEEYLFQGVAELAGMSGGGQLLMATATQD